MTKTLIDSEVEKRGIKKLKTLKKISKEIIIMRKLNIS